MVQGHFLAIDSDECGRLLADFSVGRACWLSPSGFEVLPVNYQMAGGVIVFGVRPGSVLAELAQGVDAAFQVDDIDPDTLSGWSVLVRGRTRTLQGPVPDGLESWVVGRTCYIELVPERMSGRSVLAD